MSEKQKPAPPSDPKHLRDLDGYDLVTSDSLETSDGTLFQKQHQGTNTSASYSILKDGEPVGRAGLSFGLRQQEVYFDIEVYKQGRDIGATALRGLATNLDERGLSLITGGIMEASRPYWEHLAQRGDAVPVDPTNLATTDYQIVPAAGASPAMTAELPSPTVPTAAPMPGHML